MNQLTEPLVFKKCTKCGGEVHPTAPYCSQKECLMRNVISWTISPEGYLTFVEGNKYPLRGLPSAEIVNHVALLKRCLIATARPITKSPLIIAALAVSPKQKLLRQICDWMHNMYVADHEDVLAIPPNAFCTSSREINRALKEVSEKSGIPGNHWISLLVTIYETDMAYRFRIQNILEELDKAALQRNARQEIMRLVQLNIDREVQIFGGGQFEKNIMVKRLVWGMLWFKPFKKLIVNFLMELYLPKIKMDLFDRYWVTDRFDYNYNGLTYDERQAWKAKEHADWTDSVVKMPLDATPVRPAITFNQPNDAFYRLPPSGAEHMAEQVKQALIKNYHDKHQTA